MWRVGERLWQPEKKGSLPTLSCVSRWPEGMQQRFFFFSCLPFSSNSCGSGCAYVARDRWWLAARPSWPFWEVDEATHSPVFAHKQFCFSNYLTATLLQEKSVPILSCTFCCRSQITVHWFFGWKTKTVTRPNCFRFALFTYWLVFEKKALKFKEANR